MFKALFNINILYFVGFLVPILLFHKTRFSAAFMVIASIICIKNINKKSIQEFLENNREMLTLVSFMFIIFFIGLIGFNLTSLIKYKKSFLSSFNKMFFALIISSLFFISNKKLYNDREFSENFLKFLFLSFIISSPIVALDYNTSFGIQKLLMSKKIGYYRVNPGSCCYVLLSIFYFLFFAKHKKYSLATLSLSFGFMISIFGIIFQHSGHTALEIFLIGLLSFAIQKFISRKKLLILIKISLIAIFLFPVIMYFVDLNTIRKLEKIFKMSLLHRICIWHNAAIFIKEKSNIFQLFFGHGLASYKFIVSKYEQIQCTIYGLDNHTLDAFVVHPHNFTIELLFETGIFGSIISFLLLKKLLTSELELYPLFNALIFIIFSSHSVWSSWVIYFGIFLIFLSKLYKIARDFTSKK